LAVKHTILLVDDSKADVELVRRSLSTGPGAPALMVAEDGVEALRILRREPSQSSPRPDLIVLDLNLPRKSGHHVLAEIKQDETIKHIPVVVFTSSSADRDIATAYGCHANCYMTKPMDIDSFTAAMQAIESFWFSLVKLPSRR
jgi:chemotaxis family two-component system response regulator Rcp1